MIRDLGNWHDKRWKKIILYPGSKKMEGKTKDYLKHVRHFCKGRAQWVGKT